MDENIASSDDELRTMGEILQGWRQEGGLTQGALGRAAGYGSNESSKSAAVAISRIENGKVYPTRLRKLLEVLGHTKDELREAVAMRLSRGEGTVPSSSTSRLDLERRRVRIEERTADLNDRVQRQYARWSAVGERLEQNLSRPFFAAAAIVNLTGDHVNAGQSQGRGWPELEKVLASMPLCTNKPLLDVLLSGWASGVLAVAARPNREIGEGFSRALYRHVVSSAIASTGTPIADLHGVARKNAALAKIGLGTRAAGGFGVAGGQMVLRGVAVSPLLILTGGAAALGGYCVKRLQKEYTRLNEAELMLRDLEDVLDGSLELGDRQIALMSAITDLGRELHQTVVAPSLSFFEVVEWGELEAAVQSSIRLEARLIDLAAEVEAIPIWWPFLTVGGVEQDSADTESFGDQAAIKTHIEEAEQKFQVLLDEAGAVLRR